MTMLSLTMHIVSKVSFLPALVAGFLRVPMWHEPGMVKMSVIFSLAVRTSARLAGTLVAMDPSSSHLVARASTLALLAVVEATVVMTMIAICLNRRS